jgi:MFS family permease
MSAPQISRSNTDVTKERLFTRDYTLLWSGQAVSVLGDFFGNAAQSVLVYELTGSKVAMGTLWLAFMLPMVFIRMFCGPLIDRLDRRRLLMTMDFVRGITYALSATFTLLGIIHVWHLFLFAVIIGTAEAIFQPALMAFLPDLVSDRLLIKANASIQNVTAIMSLIGPAVGSGLVKLVGAAPALYVDAAAFTFSACMFLLLRSPKETTTAVEVRKSSYFQELKAGYRFFGQHRELIWLALMVSITNMGAMAINAQILPYALEQLKTDILGMGFLQSSYAIGTALGATIVGRLGERENRRFYTMGALFISGIFNASLALTHHLWLAIAINFLNGILAMFFNINSNAIYQKLVPDRVRGRVFAVRLLLAQGSMPLGSFFGGLAAQAWGLQPMIIIAGIVPSMIALWAYFQKTLKRIDGELTPAEFVE